MHYKSISSTTVFKMQNLDFDTSPFYKTGLCEYVGKTVEGMVR